MRQLLDKLFSSNEFIPHGHCYLWKTPLVGLHVTSDFLIAIAYFSIPAMLIYFVYKRSDVPFLGIFKLFGAFIVLCGTGHLLDIWTLWHPTYWLSGIEQAGTALVSCYTALQMVTLLPQFLALKTPEQLEAINRELQKEIAERHRAEMALRQANEELEIRVSDRTAELSETLRNLQSEIIVREQTQTALQESAERERAISQVIQKMRQTLNLQTIFSTTTQELRQAIRCDRVVVYRLNSEESGEFVSESVASRWQPLKLAHTPPIPSNLDIPDVVEDIYLADLTPDYLQLFQHLQARAYITVPIFCGRQLWGLLVSYHNASHREWSQADINVVIQIGTQLGVAVQQAELLAQTQRQSADLRTAKEAADAANRAKSEFLANMSHELRTPLNAIIGFTQVMNRDASLSPEHQQQLNIINRSGEHLLELINDILEMSKIEAGKTVLHENSFDLFTLLDSLEEMFSLKAKSQGLQLIFERFPDVPRFISADESKLRQVLINLLGNAIKFTEQGGITLRVRRQGSHELQLFEAQTDRPLEANSPFFLEFEVEDSGLGIDPAEKEKLFEAFVQTERSQKFKQGTGLGLSICRKFVELMGGQITVSSVVGQGTIFAFNISAKLVEGAIPAKQKIRKVVGLAAGQPEYRILVVEDRFENRLLLVKLLTSVGFQVREAENGREAVHLWESWEPHLIWMDMRMPILDGYEATKQIREHLKGQATVIIALTASAFEEQRSIILSAGCNDFLRKPFRDNVLLEKIAEHLGVRYIYEDSEKQTAPQSSDANAQSASTLETDLLQMPSEWRTQLQQAALECSDRLIFSLIERIPPDKAPLASVLRDLTNNFLFDRLLELLQ